MGIQLKDLKSKQVVLEKSKDSTSVLDFLQKDLSFSKGLSDKKKFRLFKDLSLLLSAGVDIRKALELTIEGEKKPSQQVVLKEVLNNIVKGATLSESLQQANNFSEYDYYSIKIGEESGTINTILYDLANFYEGKLEFKRRLVSTFSYPIIVLTTAIVAVVFMLNFIVPIFEDAFSRFGGELPFLTKKVLQLSEFIQTYGYFILLFFLGISLTFYGLRNQAWFRKQSTTLLLKIPVIGNIVLKTNLSRFCHSMNLLIRVNNPLINSISLVRKMIRFYPLELALSHMEKDIMNGSLLNESMKKYAIFPKRMTSLIQVAEEINKLDKVFEQIQSQYASETENSSKTIGSLLEPFLIIFIGLFVGIILIAMYLPLFELGSGIQ